MYSSRKCLASFVSGVLLHLLAVCSAYGDDTGRPATLQEQEFYQSIQELLAAALPSDAPEGWEITGQTETAELEFVARDTETSPLSVEYYLEWTNIIQEQQAQDAAIDKISEVTATPPVSDAQIVEYEQLAAKVAEAVAAGNLTAVQSLQQEMEQKAALINSAFAAVDEKIAEISQETAVTDSCAGIYLFANSFYQSFTPEAKQIVVAGYPAFRTEGYFSPTDGWKEGSTLVFLGDRWLPAVGASAYQFAGEENALRTKLQSIVVWIVADMERTESIVAMIDWQTLQAALDE